MTNRQRPTAGANEPPSRDASVMKTLEECMSRLDEIFWWVKLLTGCGGKIPAMDEIVSGQHLQGVAARHFAEH